MLATATFDRPPGLVSLFCCRARNVSRNDLLYFGGCGRGGRCAAAGLALSKVAGMADNSPSSWLPLLIGFS